MSFKFALEGSFLTNITSWDSPLSKEKEKVIWGLFKGVNIKKDVIFLSRVGTGLEY